MIPGLSLKFKQSRLSQTFREKSQLFVKRYFVNLLLIHVEGRVESIKFL